MIEKTLDTFIKIIINYFRNTYNIDIEINTPYLISNLSDLNFDYTGAINISGKYSGTCYFSTQKSLLQKVLASMTINMDIDIESDVILGDIAGEIANTLSGNARAHLGEDFIISIPKVYRGSSSLEAITNTERTYAIPIFWKDEKAFLAINLT